MCFDFRYELGKMTPRIANGAKLYVFCDGGYWDYICKEFKFLAGCNIEDYIDGFIDNGTCKKGVPYHDKQVYNLLDIDTQKDIVLIADQSWLINMEVIYRLLPFNMYESNALFWIGWDFNILARYASDRMRRFKNKHKGERCFIIGNGPSLSTCDLGKLINEVTFAANRIYLLYERTPWRPTYYSCIDSIVFSQIHEEVAEKVKSTAFFPRDLIMSCDNLYLNDFYWHLLDHRAYLMSDRKPSFSEDPFITQSGATASYNSLQFAAYMGFSDIYLLGVDHSLSFTVTLDGRLTIGDTTIDHFDKDYFNTNPSPVHIDIVNQAYAVAREYCDLHGIKIRNATRGGKLEAFERVDFDSLF